MTAQMTQLRLSFKPSSTRETCKAAPCRSAAQESNNPQQLSSEQCDGSGVSSVKRLLPCRSARST